MSVALDFGWSTCQFSLADFLSYEVASVHAGAPLSWAVLQNRFEEAFTCSGQEYGFYYGNDRPLWSMEIGENLR